MDYFSELLESYNKLKKRTFKLTYITEGQGDEVDANFGAGEAAAQAAITANLVKIQKAGASNPAIVQGVGLDRNGVRVEIEMWIGPSTDISQTKVDGKVTRDKVIKAKSGKSFGEVAKFDGELSPVSKDYKEFIGKFIDGDSTEIPGGAVEAERIKNMTPEEKDAEAKRKAEEKIEAEAIRVEEERKEARKKVGGLLTQMTEEAKAAKEVDPTIDVPDYSAVIGSLEQMSTDIEDFTKRDPNSEGMKWLKANGNRYLAGGEEQGSWGLERKLATAKGLAVVDNKTGKTKVVDISVVLMAEAAESAAFLTSFLASPGQYKHKLTDRDGRCIDVKQRIGMLKGKLVLFGQTPKEGIVIGKPNKLMSLALEEIAKTCKITAGGKASKGLTQLIGDGVNQAEKNAVKGTFFEAVLVLQGKLIAAMQLPDDTKKSKLFKANLLTAIGKEFRDTLEGKLEVLKSIRSTLKPEEGVSIEMSLTQDFQAQALALLTGKAGDLKEWIVNEMNATRPFMRFMNAKNIIHGGTVSKTGQRADLQFIYDDIAVAQEKADAVGSSVKDLGDGTFSVGVGLKRLEKIKGAKFGEINTLERMLDMLKGDKKLADDDNIEPGFLESIQKKLYGEGTSLRLAPDGTPAREAMVAYASGLEESIAEDTKGIVEPTTHLDPDTGELKITSSEYLIDLLADGVADSLDADALFGTSLVRNAFFDIVKGPPKGVKLRNVKGDTPLAIENRARCRETLSRAARFTRLKRDLADTNTSEAAMDYILNSVMICGSNKDAMTQLVVDDKGTALPVEHNKVFDQLASERNAGKLTADAFTFNGASVTICTLNGLCVSFQQEGTSAIDNQRATRSLAKVTKATLQASVNGNLDLPEAENSSTLMQYLSGQMRLLETLISQSK